MFFRITLLSAIIVGLIYWYAIRLKPEDAIHYKKLMSESIELRARKALEEEPAQQTRKNVRKDFWTDNETRCFTLISEDSNLTIRQKKDKVEVSEQLNTISGIAPDGLTIRADSGLYTPENLILNQPSGSFASHDFHFTAKTLQWDEANDLLYLIDEVKITQSDDLILLSHRGIVHLNKWQPTEVILQGEVKLISSRLQERKSFALADELHFDPVAQTFLFSSEKRVLFWQDGLKLSANEVLIRKDQTVQGLGDVHFTFDLEEQNTINRFFNRYL